MEAKDDVEAGLIAELETESDTIEVPLLTKEGDQKSNPGNSLGQLWKHWIIHCSKSSRDCAPNAHQEAWDCMLTHLQGLVTSAK